MRQIYLGIYPKYFVPYPTDTFFKIATLFTVAREASINGHQLMNYENVGDKHNAILLNHKEKLNCRKIDATKIH